MAPENSASIAAGPALNVSVSSLVPDPNASSKNFFCTPTRAGACVMLGK